MLQVAISGGEVRVVEVPEPVVRPGTVLVRTSHSLISSGTEGASIGSGGRRENIVIKALRNPALVKKVVDRVASHGLRSTAELVRTRNLYAQAGYAVGKVDLLTLLNSLLTLQDSQLELHSEIVNHEKALARLEAVTGGPLDGSERKPGS